MGGVYTNVLDRIAGIAMLVEYTIEQHGPGVIDYSMVLIAVVDGRPETIRVYDGAHGENELHRHTRDGGKQAAEIFDRGTLGEGMRPAVDEVKHGYRVMIEAWSNR
jgi:hypothetical protein